MRQQDLLREALDLLRRDDEEHQRLKVAELDDKKFYSGDQWGAAERERRRRKHLPTQTNNLLQKYVAQLEGDDILNMTQAKVEPDGSGTREEAEIREGILRMIQNSPQAKVAFNVASRSAIICGVGNFALSVNEAGYDVFDKDVNIDPIYNTHTVVWDRNSVEPTGEDADHVFQVDPIDPKEFERLFGKKAAKADVMSTGFLDRVTRKVYASEQERRIRVGTWWRMEERDATVALMQDLSSSDITGVPKEQWFPFVARDEGGEPIIRETKRPIAVRRIMSGVDWLDDPIELPISSLPVFRITGRYELVGEDFIRWGLVRLLKDSQALNNYWDSAIVRLLQLATFPQPYKVPSGAIRGQEDRWIRYWENEDGILEYNPDFPAPEREQPLTVHPALFAERERAAQYMSDISNMNEASLGSSGNERSRVAIEARQRVASLGTASFTFHRDLAKQRCGRVMNELIPYVYDSRRIMSLVNPKNEAEVREINQVADPSSRITNAKYRVTITTGPSYATKMQEQSDILMTALERAPQVMTVALDKMMEGFGLHDVAKRVRSQLPSGVVQPDEMTPEEQQAAQARGEAEAEQAEVVRQMAAADLALKQAQVAEAQARAEQARAMAFKAMTEAGLEPEKVEIDRIKANARADRDQSSTAKTISEIGVAKDREERERLKNITELMKAANEDEKEKETENGE